ncbi:MAG: hypothetical protein ACM3U2_23745 [Deltaproteobacteria bacterium]
MKKFVHDSAALGLATAIVLIGTALASAETWTVTGNDPDGLKFVISAAQDGDTIILDASYIDLYFTYYETIYRRELYIDKNLTILGNATKISAGYEQDSPRVFEIAPGAEVTMSGLTIAGGGANFDDSSGYGGNILNFGTLTLNDCVVQAAETSVYAPHGVGGGIANFGTTTLNNCTVTGNIATYEVGGGIYNAGVLTLNYSKVTGNYAETSGGGIFNDVTGTLRLIKSTLSKNNALDGADLYNLGEFSADNNSHTGKVGP